MDIETFRVMLAATAGLLKPGQFNFPMAQTGVAIPFVIPENVYKISAVVVEGGQGGGQRTGGRGGKLRWKNDIPVTPGETLTAYQGLGGTGRGNSSTGNAGQASYLARGSTMLLSTDMAVGVNGVGGGEGGAGGAARSSSTSAGTVYIGGSGGGAAGYSGNGGDGAGTAATAGLGGGGGGGGRDTRNGYVGGVGQGFAYGGTRGGGVGLKGQGANGAAGSNGAPPADGGDGSGGAYGAGGSAAGEGTADTTAGSSGFAGGVRVMYGDGRAYPSTRTADE